jgi:hypothetical protein
MFAIFPFKSHTCAGYDWHSKIIKRICLIWFHIIPKVLFRYTTPSNGLISQPIRSPKGSTHGSLKIMHLRHPPRSNDGQTHRKGKANPNPSRLPGSHSPSISFSPRGRLNPNPSRLFLPPPRRSSSLCKILLLRPRLFLLLLRPRLHLAPRCGCRGGGGIVDLVAEKDGPAGSSLQM